MEPNEGSIPLNYAQYVYQKGKSTDLAIERAILFKGFSLGALLDIEGALDNTGYDAIRRALTRRNIDRATKG